MCMYVSVCVIFIIMYCILCLYLCDFITAINLQINNLYYGLRCNKVSDSDSDSVIYL